MQTQPSSATVPSTAEWDRLKAIDQNSIVHSWSAQDDYRSELMVGAEGAHYWDEAGNRYLDFASQAYFANVGAGCERIVEAMSRQVRELPYAYLLGNIPKLELADKLLSFMPAGYTRVWFGCNGSDSIELALKVARLVTGRQSVIAFQGEYHGASMGATSVTGQPRLKRGIGTPVPGTIFLPGPSDRESPIQGATQEETDQNTLALLRHTIVSTGPESIAGVLAEPIPTGIRTGATIPGRDYWREVQRLCEESDLLLMSDEIVTGFGRTGHWFARDYYSYEPDIICLGKGLTSGYFPLSATVFKDGICERVRGTFLPHGLTYAGHPLGCAAAIANIETIEEDDLLSNVARVGSALADQLASLRQRHPVVSGVSSLGLWAGLELEAASPVPSSIKGADSAREDGEGPASRIVAAMKERGVIVRGGDRTIKLAPPLIVTREDVDLVMGVIDDLLSDLERGTL